MLHLIATPCLSLLLTSAAFAQLPPSALRPQQPGQPSAPSMPGRPFTPAAPVTPPAVDPVSPPVADASAEFTNVVPNTLTAEEQAAGWKLLFDGTRLIGIKGAQRADPLSAGWKIEAGELVLPKEIKDTDRVTGGDLVTMEAFVDFDFRFDWKSTVSANSGVRYMVAQMIGQPPSGMEYQIIDDMHSPISLKGGPIRRSGALDNVLPVGSNARLRVADPLNKIGDPWNEGRIVVQGTTVQHWMNGEKVLEFQLGPQLRTIAERNWTRDSQAARPGAYFGTKTRGAIALLDEGTEIAFRNLKVRHLAAQPTAQRPISVPSTAVSPANGTTARPSVPNPFLIPPKK